MQWRLYWPRHIDDSLPYDALVALLSAKERIRNVFISGSSSLNIDNSSGYYSNKWSVRLVL